MQFPIDETDYGIYPPSPGEGSSWEVNLGSWGSRSGGPALGMEGIYAAKNAIDNLQNIYGNSSDEAFDIDTVGGFGEPDGPEWPDERARTAHDQEYGTHVIVIQRDADGNITGRVPSIRIGYGDDSYIISYDEAIRMGNRKLSIGTPGFIPQYVDESGAVVDAATVNQNTNNTSGVDSESGEGTSSTTRGPSRGSTVSKTGERVESVSDLPDVDDPANHVVISGKGYDSRAGAGGGSIEITVGNKVFTVPEWVGDVGAYLTSIGAKASLVSAVQNIETKKDREVQAAKDQEIADIRDSKIQELEEEIDGLRQEDISELNEEKTKRLQEINTEIEKLREEKIDSLKADINLKKEEELENLKTQIEREEADRLSTLDNEIQSERERREAELEQEISDLSDTEKAAARDSLNQEIEREKRQKLSELENQIASERDTRMSDLQSEIDQKYDSLTAELESARSTKFSDLDEDYNDRLSDYNSQVSNVQNQISDLSQTKSTLTEDVSNLSGQRDDLNLTIDELTGRAATQQEALSGLTSEQLAARQNLNELLAQQTQTKSDIDELLGQKQTLSTDYSNLQSSFSGIQTDYKGMQTKYQDLALELEDINKKIEEANNNPIFDDTDPSPPTGDPGAGGPGAGGPGTGTGDPNNKDPADDGDIFKDNEPTTPSMSYNITGRGRIVPETREEVLRDLFGFAPDYGNLVKTFGPEMAEASGQNIEAFGSNVGGPVVDIAEMFTQRRSSGIADAMGIQGDFTIDAAADAAARINPVLGSMIEGAQSLNPLLQRMEAEAGVLTDRQRRGVQQASRGVKERTGRGLGTSAFVDEIGNVIQSEKIDLAQDTANIAGIRGQQAGIGTQVSALQQPFVSTAIGAGDIQSGMGFASGVAGMAADAVPTAADLFSLQAQERDFALQQQALDQAAKAGDFDAVTTILGGLRAGQKLGVIPGQEDIQGFVKDIFGGIKGIFS